MKRVEISSARGPYSSTQAAASFSMEEMAHMAKAPHIFWAGHGKSSYYSVRGVSQSAPPTWVFAVPSKTTTPSLHYGRLNLYEVDDRVAIRDNATREWYLCVGPRDAIETAAWIVYGYPDERVWPVAVGRSHSPAKSGLYRAPSELSEADARPWVSRMAGAPDAKAIEISASDAIVLLSGGSPSPDLLSTLAGAFPQALMVATGPALVAVDQPTNSLRVGRSLAMFAADSGVSMPDALATFAANLTVGSYLISGGWALDALLRARNDRAMLALTNMALESASSPASLEATLTSLQGVV